jgi:hypothetical protein
MEALMESPVEIRYAGVVIGRAQEVRSAEGDSPSFFLVVREPMPVGSVVHLRTGDRETPARVVRALESSDPATCGMQVRLIGEAEEVATEWIPTPAVPAEKVRPVVEPLQTAMPVIEVKIPIPPLAGALHGAEAAPQGPGPSETAPPAEPAAEAAEAVPAAEAAPAAEPAAAAVAEPPSAATAASEEAAAIPEAVPVAVGSSMTGALEKAAEGEPAPVEASPSEASKESSASADDSAEGEEERATGSVGVAGEPATSEDLPPARPISGPSGRRKTKRRR